MLTQRQGTVLRFLVSEYIDTATAVGSETLVRKRRLRVSPATVRNDMGELADAGYIIRPHSSAGGVPSERGYRYYVESGAGRATLSPSLKWFVQRRLGTGIGDVEEWVEGAAESLAEMVANIAIVTAPRMSETRMRHLELVRLHGDLTLLVVVLEEATLRKEVFTLREPLDQDSLTSLANRLNARWSSRSYADILAMPTETASVEGQVRERVLLVLRREDDEQRHSYFTYGLRHLLRQPEFSEGSATQMAVDMLEDRALLRGVLSQLEEGGEVRVTIGRENPQDTLHLFSVVIGQYGLPGGATGTVGVIGPTRMRYHQTIAAVRYVAAFMSRLLATSHDA